MSFQLLMRRCSWSEGSLFVFKKHWLQLSEASQTTIMSVSPTVTKHVNLFTFFLANPLFTYKADCFVMLIWPRLKNNGIISASKKCFCRTIIPQDLLVLDVLQFLERGPSWCKSYSPRRGFQHHLDHWSTRECPFEAPQTLTDEMDPQLFYSITMQLLLFFFKQQISHRNNVNLSPSLHSRATRDSRLSICICSLFKVRSLSRDLRLYAMSTTTMTRMSMAPAAAMLIIAVLLRGLSDVMWTTPGENSMPPTRAL